MLDLAVPIAFGLLVGVLSLVLMRLLNLADRTGPYVVATVAIASYYIVFALQSGDATTVAVQVAVAFGFIVLAALGAVFSPWWIVAALGLHAVFDCGECVPTQQPGPRLVGRILFCGRCGVGNWIGRMDRT